MMKLVRWFANVENQSKVRNRVFEWSVIVTLLLVTYVGYTTVREIYREFLPAESWINYSYLNVPDFTEHAAPDVDAERVVTRDLEGQYFVEVHTEDGSQVCSGNGAARYDMFESEKIRMPFLRFINTDRCDLKPGRYKITLTVTVRDREGFPPKTVRVVSNVFNVLPAS